MGSDPSRDNDGAGSDDSRFHRGSDPIFPDCPRIFDLLKVLIEPFEDRFHGFICPLPIHVEVYAVF